MNAIYLASPMLSMLWMSYPYLTKAKALATNLRNQVTLVTITKNDFMNEE